jgi:hypothetical protein
VISTRLLSRWQVLSLLCILVATVTGCASGPSGDIIRSGETKSEDGLANSREVGEHRVTVEWAARFAGVVLPGHAEPIGAYDRQGIDRFVAFAIRLPSDDIPAVLRSSQFHGDFRAGLAAQYQAVEGVRLMDTSRVRSAQDEYRKDGVSVIRDIAVLTEDGGSAVLNVWAYTT